MTTTRTHSPRPIDALEAHVALISALRKPRAGAELMLAAERRRRMAMFAEHGEGKRLFQSSAALARDVASKLDSGTTIIVTDHMMDEALRRMDSIEFGDPLRADDLALFDSGFVVLPRPMHIPSDPESYAAFDAMMWVPSDTVVAIETLDRSLDQYSLDRWPSSILTTDAPQNGILCGQCQSMTLLVTEANRSDEVTPAHIEEATAKLHGWGLTYVPVYITGWAFDLSWDPANREEEFALSRAGEVERRFWLSLLRLLSEEVLAPVHLPRAAVRRSGRTRAQVPDVVVADLRRVKHRDREEATSDGGVIMWSHRWKVRAHTRMIHAGTPKERTVPVREHIKGPENMPLLEKDRVWRLTR